MKILNKVESEDEKDAIITEYKQLQDKIDMAMRSQNSIYKWITWFIIFNDLNKWFIIFNSLRYALRGNLHDKELIKIIKIY